MRTMLCSALVLGAMTTAVLAEPARPGAGTALTETAAARAGRADLVALTEAQMDRVTAGGHGLTVAGGSLGIDPTGARPGLDPD